MEILIWLKQSKFFICNYYIENSLITKNFKNVSCTCDFVLLFRIFEEILYV